MNPGGNWQQIFYSQIWALPYLLMLIGCQCCALGYSRRYPTVCLLAFVGFGLLLLSLITSSATTIWMISSGPRGANRAFLILSQTMRMLIHAGGYVLIVMAIFGYRSDPHKYRNDALPTPLK